jgi:Zn-finger nucleic acid-binding protein
MLCPVDNTTLQTASFGAYPIHRCPQCLGVSVKGDVLREVRAYAALELQKQQGVAATVRPCPHDGKAMKSLGYKGVAMCACQQCLGLWLDAGQFSRLLDLLEPPKQADLSKIGQSLPTIRSKIDTGGIEGLGDILEIASDVFNTIGKLAD